MTDPDLTATANELESWRENAGPDDRYIAARLAGIARKVREVIAALATRLSAVEERTTTLETTAADLEARLAAVEEAQAKDATA